MKNTTFCTIVSGDYVWYAPLFLYALNQQMPNAKVVIFSRDPIPEELPAFVRPHISVHPYPTVSRDPNTTAALRFLVNFGVATHYALITDIDVLHMAQSPSIEDARRLDTTISGTRAYSNYSQGDVAGFPRPQGVHFVNSVWWPVTATARKNELVKLHSGEPADVVDEAILGRVILASGLPPPPQSPNLSNTHGVHLGAYRKGFMCTPPGKECTFIAGMLRDPAFMELVGICGERLPFVRKLFAYWRKELAA